MVVVVGRGGGGWGVLNQRRNDSPSRGGDRNTSRGVLRISIDGDDQKDIFGFECSIPGFFWV